MAKQGDGGSAFPIPSGGKDGYGNPTNQPRYGMSLRDYFAGQALGNQTICTGSAPDYELTRWFGGRGGITRAEIVAAQAHDYADAMLGVRAK